NERLDGKKQLLSKVYINPFTDPIAPDSLQGTEGYASNKIFVREVRIHAIVQLKLAGQLYLEWVLPSDPATLKKLVDAFQLASEYRRIFLSLAAKKSANSYQRIFVEKKGAWPYSLYAASLTGKKERILGLLIQSFGQVFRTNPLVPLF
ncbi:hypothetical protein QBC45DRAFT_340686, partial [Copromyces sp. CBS 386.78]